jgi:hypothetical protein
VHCTQQIILMELDLVVPNFRPRAGFQILLNQLIQKIRSIIDISYNYQHIPIIDYSCYQTF